MRLRETPVPIPNTTVKPQPADGTMLETAWESRWMPDSFKKYSKEFYNRTGMFQRMEKIKSAMTSMLTRISRAVLFR